MFFIIFKIEFRISDKKFLYHRTDFLEFAKNFLTKQFFVMKKSQYSRPLIQLNSNTYQLERNHVRTGDNESRDENWLQDLIYKNPRLLPVEEIEPSYLDLYPVCRELPVKNVGSLDALFVNKHGLLSLVECKLWKNPEARREVVGQILDYAQELSRWDFEELNKAVKKSEENGCGLVEKVKASCQDENWDEISFIDAVTQNLRKGQFLLLIVGDGIREGVENISDFLQNYASLNFSFALVEQAIFDLPKQMGEGFLVQPRVLCKTLEIERAVITIEGKKVKVVSSKPDDKTRGTSNRATSQSDKMFFDKVAQATSNEIKDELAEFFEEIEQNELQLGGKKMRIIQSVEPLVENPSGKLKEFNFVRIADNGTVDFKGWSGPVGTEYKKKLASLGNDWRFVNDDGNDYNKNIVNGSGGRINLGELFEVKSDWSDLIVETLEKLKDTFNNGSAGDRYN